MAENTNLPNPLNDSSEGHWQVVWDVTHRKWYYVEQALKKVSWEQPPGCSLSLPTSPPAGAEDLDTLPAGWRAYYDPNSGKICFQNLETKASQWHRPASNEDGNAQSVEEGTASRSCDALPQGWRKHRDEKSNRDYYISPDNATQWEHPSQTSQNGSQSKAYPEDWEPRWDSENARWCFINNKTGQHQYDKRPDGLTKELPEPPELPQGWSAAWDNKQNRFYFLSPDKKTQWVVPPLLAKAECQAQDELPPGWKKAFDKNHKRDYYYNHDRNVTQWEPPVGLAISEKQHSTLDPNSAATNRQAESSIEATRPITEKSLANTEAKDEPTKQILKRSELVILAKLILREEATTFGDGVNTVIAKYWKDRPSAETTTLKEFLDFLNI